MASAWALLDHVCDPEIPVLTLRDLGILREVRVADDGELEVVITPTYSGCPAMKHMEQEIQRSLKMFKGIHLKLETVYFPPWTTSWISVEARNKLQAYGIAPPEEETERKAALWGVESKIQCPRCKQQQSKLISQFGSTACKALYQCQSCMEPFDYFKCL
ncbi:MAG: 1,2-phenylacetyl-CoA epoxidase subunit PaaD [Bacteroidia bacterium]